MRGLTFSGRPHASGRAVTRRARLGAAALTIACLCALLSPVPTPAAAQSAPGPIENDRQQILWESFGVGGGASSVRPVAMPGNTSEIVYAENRVALTADGTVWTWDPDVPGDDDDDGGGALAATTGNPVAPLSGGAGTALMSSAVPIASPVEGLPPISAIAASSQFPRHVLALDHDGTVWAWGCNTVNCVPDDVGGGQLGDGTTISRDEPAAVAGLPEIVDVKASPGVSMALDVDGRVWTWGFSPLRPESLCCSLATAWGGQLGQGPAVEESLVPGLVSTLSGIVAISAGNEHSMALSSSGTAYSWGSNRRGELGLGLSQLWRPRATPAAIPLAHPVSEIAAGTWRSMLLTTSGSVYAWGGEFCSTLYLQSCNVSPALQMVNIASISGTGAHAVARANDGSRWGWGGWGTWGPFGDGVTDLGFDISFCWYGQRCAIRPISPGLTNITATWASDVTYYVADNVPPLWVQDLFGFLQRVIHVADPVNPSTGNFTDTWADLDLPPAAGPFRWSRTYNSLDETPGILGRGWSTPLDARVDQYMNDDAIFRTPEGRLAVFTGDGDDGYVRPEEINADLTRVDDGWLLEWRTGDAWHFDRDGRLEQLVGWNGVTSSVNWEDAQPRAVTSSLGYQIQLTYGDSGNLDALELSDGRMLTFGRNTDGLLTSVTRPGLGTEEFLLDASGRIAEIRDPAGRPVVENVYDEFGRVVEQTTADGDTIVLEYDDSNRQTIVTDTHSGDVTVYTHDAEGRMVSVTDAAGGVIERDYDEWGNVTSFIDRRAGQYSREFDAAGNLLSSTGPDGVQSTSTWDALNRLVSTTDAEGHTTSYTYDGNERVPASVTSPDGSTSTIESNDGLVERVVDPDGVETIFTYDAQRNLASVTDGEGNTTSYTHDSAGRVLTTTSPLGHVNSTSYDISGQVLTETDAAGGVTTYSYNAAGEVVSITDPLGAITSYSYGSSGRLQSETDPEGNVTTYTYDASGDLVAVTRPGGATTSYTYGPLARLLKVVSPEGVETHFGYDADGNRTTTVLGPDPTDAARTSTSVFDALGRVVEELGPIGALDPNGQSVRSRTTTTYDSAGRVIETTKGEGSDLVRTWFRYDEAGRLRFEIVDLDGDGAHHDPTSADPAERDPADRVTEYTYTQAGRLLEIIQGPTGVDEFDWVTGGESAKRITTHTYDDAGRLILVANPLAGTTATWYDADGRVEQTETPGGALTRFDYDPVGRVLARYSPSPTGAGEAVERWVYDLAGQVVEHQAPHDPAASASAPRSTFGHHPGGTLAWVRDPRQDIWGDRVETSFAYDGRGNLVEQRSWSNDLADDPDSWSEIVETWAWDLDDRLVAHTRPGGGTTSYGYDPATGWLTTITHPSGRTESFEHWPGGAIREQRWSMPDTADLVVSRWYDSLGRQTKITDPTGGTTYSWDRNGALTGVAGPTQATSFGYDQHGHRTGIGYPWGFDVHYSLDPLGRPVALTQGDIERAAWTYDPDSRVLTETIGPDATGGTATWTWPTNGAHRPVGYQQQLADNLLRTYTLDWNHAGHLTQQTRNGTTETFTYDPAGQLTSRQRGDDTWTWTYNTRGLITHTTTATAAGNEARHTNFNADGQPTTGTSHWTNGWVVPTSYDHDHDGRLTQARLATTPVFTASYDQRGLPTSITTHWDGQPRTTQRVYDGDGYLVGLDPGTGLQPLTWDRTRPDGDLLATHRLGVRQGLVSYLHGPTGGVGVHYGPVWLGGINRDPHASNLNHYYLDGFDPWGNPEGVTAPARFGLGYRGELVIDGLIHLRNRDYHPTLHTFTTPDPLDGVPATPTLNSRYHYANNNPFVFVDPLGLRAKDSDLLIAIDYGGAQSRSIQRVLRRQPGRGSVRIGLYIPSELAGVPGVGVAQSKGDARGPSPYAHLSRYRAVSVIDYESGLIEFTINPSCGHAGPPSDCQDALPITSDFGSVGRWAQRLPGVDYSNRVSIDERTDGSVRIRWAILNSNKVHLSPAIDGSVTVRPVRTDSVCVDYERDSYPALEIYHYRPGRLPETVYTQGAAWGAPIGLWPLPFTDKSGSTCFAELAPGPFGEPHPPLV